MQKNDTKNLWAPPGQFNSPIPDIDDIIKKEIEIFLIESKNIPGIDLREKQQIALLTELLNYFSSFKSFYLQQSYHNLRFTLNGGNNIFYSYIDAMILWGMIKHYQPSKIIEIGSGYSSALMLDINEYGVSWPLHFTFIEPFPERLFSLLKENDKKDTRIITNPIQEVDPDIFLNLSENDILFIDSSHVCKTGSDVNHILFSILPRLKKGVLVHFHDIFFPFEYRKDWVLEGRAWNEAYVCRAFMMYNSAFQISLFNSFLEHFNPELFVEPYKYFPKKESAGLWISKV